MHGTEGRVKRLRLIDADAMIDRLKEWDTKDKTDKALYNFTLNRINEQPTIQPKQHWIPCGERMPEEDLWIGVGKQSSDSVLMTVYDENSDDLIVDYGHTTDGEWYSETVDEYIEVISEWKVIAWMPLPNSYKGERK